MHKTVSAGAKQTFMKLKKSKRRTINILKLVIGLTIFRRWRAVHGAEEQPSPSGFAMVFHKAPASPNNNSPTTKNATTLLTNANQQSNKKQQHSNKHQGPPPPLLLQTSTNDVLSTKDMVIFCFFFICHSKL